MSGNVIKSKINAKSAEFQKNSRQLIDRLTVIKNEEETIRQGGGAKAIDAQHNKGRMTARERIAKLIDPKTSFFELGLYAAYEMYEEWGGAPSAGTITGLARVADRQVMIIANDATVKAGAFFPMTAKKVIRAQNIAIENRIPTIYLVDSAGIFLPLQEDVFPDTDDFGRVFRNNAVMSAMGIPQITAIMGMCVAGGAYLPVMCDEILMTEGSGLFLAGPALVQAAIGQKTSAEELGGAQMHAQISGTVDFREPDDEACLKRLRSLVDKIGRFPAAPFDRKPAKQPAHHPEEIYGIFSGEASRQYDMREVIARIVDASEFEEYPRGVRADGAVRLCAHRRVGGGDRGQSEAARERGRSGNGRKAHGIWRGDLYRSGGQSRAVHHGLQSECGAADISARRERVHGGQGSGMERDHPRGSEDGQRRGQQRGAENRGDLRREFWRRDITPCAERPTIRDLFLRGPRRATR